MGLEFLARVRRSTIGLALIAGLLAATYSGLARGLAVALGTAWSLANLALLEKLVVALTRPDRGTPPAVKQAAWAIGGMLPLFGAGGVLLLELPPVWLLAGFLLPYLVLLLKALSLIVLDTRAWKALVSSPWRAAMVVGAILVVAWWLVPSKLLAPARASGAARVTVATPGAPHAAATPGVPHAAVSARGPASGGARLLASAEPERAPEGGRTASAEPRPEAEGGSGAGGERAAAGGEPKEEGPQTFPNLITYVTAIAPLSAWARFLRYYEVQIFALLIALFICLVAYRATRRAQMIPGRLQNLVELSVSTLNDFITGVLGSERHARRFVPFLGTLFIYILIMNLAGLIPGLDSPTSSINTTFALAITVFIYVQYVGLRSFGPLGYVHHMLGAPRDLTTWLLAPLMLPIHVLGELAKPISLSARLFGNIFGEDMLLVAFASIGVSTLAFAHLPFGVPWQVPFLFLALLTSTLQALVFTVLSTIYLLLMLPHDESHGEQAQPAHSH